MAARVSVQAPRPPAPRADWSLPCRRTVWWPLRFSAASDRGHRSFAAHREARFGVLHFGTASASSRRTSTLPSSPHRLLRTGSPPPVPAASDVTSTDSSEASDPIARISIVDTAGSALATSTGTGRLLAPIIRPRGRFHRHFLPKGERPLHHAVVKGIVSGDAEQRQSHDDQEPCDQNYRPVENTSNRGFIDVFRRFAGRLSYRVRQACNLGLWPCSDQEKRHARQRFLESLATPHRRAGNSPRRCRRSFRPAPAPHAPFREDRCASSRDGRPVPFTFGNA